ncbi:MAG TPA: hypothetical protein VGN18_07500 [Jatrophihabitans sp.]|uniref:hypothetical protein n=1 Tax=Jatrophihabitans sp. TaxID=1932789 RepID=UPI002E0801A3|nr:hypothetical protein [Jatrophihabitans sp.]
MYDDEVRDTPPTVVGAVALGAAPLPFLAVYAVLFLVHGSIHPVQPPDITTSTGGEFVAGCIAAALFVVTIMALLWLLNGRRRWLFALVQLGVLGAAVDFLVDGTEGGSFVSFVIALTALGALVLAFAPASWRHVDRHAPRAVQRIYAPRRRDEPAPVVPASH